MKEFWNNRYKSKHSAYGYEPNEYFKQQLVKLDADKILLPAEGEGRNAVFASKLGWEVSAFDMSEQGKIKADFLAETNGVSIDYQIGGVEELTYKQAYFGAIGLIYAHFTAESKSKYHRIFDTYLRIGGIIIFEAFSKRNLELVKQNKNTNGPKDLNALFSMDELTQDFPNYEILELKEETVELNEGLYHKGQSSIIRFVGKKKR